MSTPIVSYVGVTFHKESYLPAFLMCNTYIEAAANVLRMVADAVFSFKSDNPTMFLFRANKLARPYE